MIRKSIRKSIRQKSSRRLSRSRRSIRRNSSRRSGGGRITRSIRRQRGSGDEQRLSAEDCVQMGKDYDGAALGGPNPPPSPLGKRCTGINRHNNPYNGTCKKSRNGIWGCFNSQ